MRLVMRAFFALSLVCLLSTAATAKEVPVTDAGAETSLPSLGRESDAKAETLGDTTKADKAEEKSAAKVIQAESEIPLNLEAKKTAADGGSPFLRVFLSFGILGAICIGAYFFLKKYAKPQAFKNQTQIKVLQQHYIGPKKSLAIIRVAGESILIGVTDHNINMIKSLSLMDEEVPEEAPAHFSKLVSRFSSHEVITEDAADDSGGREREDFSFGGIKDIVAKRLKGMRNLE